ncbi:hypothetical protein [Zavarzinella formosa]|uniref:hypothetical protein n=1 Tax=Zavarzinella formosa TaxID=360055 RepID=UPI0002DE7019|nr:hypothetical protein [Zavarzinella formosa]
MRVTWLNLLLITGCLAMSGGCGPTDGRRAVKGTVTYQGKPVENGTITFQTTTTPPAMAGGAPIQDGKYEIPADKGLEPGKYRVLISAAGPPAKLTPAERAAGVSARASELIPPKYNTESTLMADIKPGASDPVDFSLE